MAGGAAKKAGSRSRKASLIYYGIALAVSVVYVAARLVRGTWPSKAVFAGVVMLASMQLLGAYSIVQAAKLDTTADLAFDLFVLAAVVQLGSLWTSRAWWGLLIIPLGIAWTYGPALLAFGKQNRAEIRAEDAAAKAAEEEMAAKRKRRQEHKEKGRVVMRR